MPGFILSRILQAIPVLLIVALIAFAMFAYIGDPVLAMLGQSVTEASRAAMAHQLGLDQPFLVQYLHYVGQVLRGDFGISYRLARPVSGLILERLPATVELSVTSVVLAVLLGLPIGVYTALRHDSLLARGFMVFSLAGVSLPTFLIGILLIMAFAVWLPWLPSFGRNGVVELGFWRTSFLTLAGWKSLILPAVTLSLFQLTLIARLVRAEMLEVLRADFIRFARARGLTARAVNFSHALGNTLVPVVTIIGLQLGYVVAFSLVTETVFQWPGVGLLLVQSIAVGDIPVMAAYLLLVSVLFVGLNLLVDIFYAVIDPRLRLGALRGGAGR